MPHRHPDQIEGDLAGAEERVREVLAYVRSVGGRGCSPEALPIVRTARQRVRDLERELAAAEAATRA